ncbi:MAG: tRNA (adenosine(37)-N6)-threonylcarbamoyltransferase complex dimerization subunit type 1 TsaB [Flavobacterium sp. BFFFF2]|nr:MAG: tRNA (adenosine(37)-N6)-threonylcarbamoyltransferase complex dimerization subunit type 1 TsaB [Flavobacterium sp. BFFFF2]
MPCMLLLETATKNCSVALSEGNQLLAIREEATAHYSHAEQLHQFVLEVLAEANKKISDLDAIVVSGGPGSYTGLRIGISAAKGYGYALQIPLISLNTLDVLAQQIQIKKGSIIPLLDARRMEVYSKVLTSTYEISAQTKAEIIDAHSFDQLEGPIHLLGDGQFKCKGVVLHKDIHFHEEIVYPSARNMVSLAYKKFNARLFEDLAYYEPNYLKEFNGGN